MDWFWLYRPIAPSVRAQAIQVVNMTHAMASRGHRVTVCVDPPREGGLPTPAEVLAFYGLDPVEGLDVVVLPRAGTLASIAFRATFLAWVRRTHGRGVVYARSKKYAAQAVRWLGGHFRLVLEQHEVDSVLALDRGEDPGELRVLERRLLDAAKGLVTNCPGTLELWREVHGSLPPAIAAHNASHPSRVRRPSGPGVGVGYVGSVREVKDVRLLASAARRTSAPITLIGVHGPEAVPLLRLGGDNLRVEPPIPHRDVPDRLAAFRVLALPLAPGVFGERITSPLKLWDYLASGVPVVGADLPTLRDAAPGAFVPYRAGDEGDLVRAIESALADEALRAQVLGAAKVRTWAERAAEVEAFVKDLP